MVFVRNCSLKIENDFEAILTTFCCYDFGANASEAVQKIATDQKVHKYYLCVIVCRIVKMVSINNSKKGLATYLLGHLQR